MADAFRGLTLRIGADARPVNSAINSIKTSAGAAQKQLNAMNKALKFDGNNASALASKLDLITDQARLSANALSKITLATKQAASETVRFSKQSGIASGKLEEVAGSTKDVYSNVQRINASFNTTNAQLQRVYDSAAKVVGYKKYLDSSSSTALAETIKRQTEKSTGKTYEYAKAVQELQKLRTQMKGTGEDAQKAKSEYSKLLNSFSNQDAVNYVKRLRDRMSGTGDAAKLARTELEKYIRQAANLKSVSNEFGTQKKDADALISVWKRLQREHKTLQNDLTSIQRVEGFRALQTQAIAYKSSVAQASTELARTRAELAALGTNGRLVAPLNAMKQLSTYADAATANARKLYSAYKGMGITAENSVAKIRASRQAQAALVAELKQIDVVLDKIRNDQAFDAQAANAEDAYAKAAKVEAEYSRIASEATIAEQRVKTLNEAVSQIKSGKIDQTTEAFRQFKAVLQSLGYSDEQIDKMTASTKTLKTELSAATNQVSEFKAKLASLDSQHATAQLTMAYKDTEAYKAEAQANLKEMEASTKRMSAVFGSMRTAGYGFYSTITPLVMIAGRYAIQAADDVDSAYRNMRKTVNGTEADFESLRDAALEFGRTHYTSASELLEIEAIGGQLGIQAKNLSKFAEVVANLDIATNLDTETISENLGQLANIMDDMSQDKQTGAGSLESFSDALVRLGNNSATQEDKIMNVMMRIASMGNVCDMTTPDLLALSTAVAASGQGSEAAGTAISKTFSNIESAVNSGGDKLTLFAKTSGMSAEEFARKWSESPMEVFTAFINGLERVDEAGGSVDSTLSSLGINSVRQKQTLMNLTTQTDVLTDALTMSNDAWNGVDDEWGDAGDAAREASRKMEGFSGQLQLLKNAGQELGVEMLDGLTGALTALTGFVQGATSTISTLPDGAKTAMVLTAGAFAALGPVAVGLNSLTDMVNGLHETMKAFKETKLYNTILSTFSTESKEASTAMTAATAATEANTLATNQSAVSKARDTAAVAANTATKTANTIASKLCAAGIISETTATNLATAASTKLTTAIAVLTTTMKLVPWVAAAAAVGALVSVIGNAATASDRMSKSTDGIRNSVQGLISATNEESGSLSGLDSEVAKNTESFAEFLESQSQVADEINSTVSEMQDSIVPLQSAAKIIEEYGNKSGLTMEEQYRLRAAIETVNNACSTQYKLADEVNGGISDAAGAYDKATAASGQYKEQILKTIEAQEKQLKADAYDEVLKKAYQAQADAEIQYQKIYEKREALSKAGADTTIMDIQLAQAKSALDAATESADSTATAYGKVKEEQDALSESAEGVTEAVTGVAESTAMTEEELEDASSKLDDLTEKFPAVSSMLSGLDLNTFVQKLNDAGITMDEFSSGVEEMAEKASDGFNKIETDSEMSLDTYLENLKKNKELMQEWGTNLGSLSSLSDDTQYQSWINELREAGPEQASFIAELASADKETIMQTYQAWVEACNAGSTAYTTSASNVMAATQEATAQATMSAEALKATTATLDQLNIGYTVTDNGTVAIAEEDLSRINRETLADKGFIVTDNGTIIDMSAKCDSLSLKTIDGKLCYVTDNGSVYDTEGKFIALEAEINDKVPSRKDIKVNALTDSAQTTLSNLNTYLKNFGNAGTKATVSLDTSSATSSVSGFTKSVNSIPKNPKVSISTNASTAKTGVDSLKRSLDNLPGSKFISIYRTVHESTVRGNASGGVVPAHARGALIPAHADGGINGIVTRATMTNVGWVGEAGAEAVFNMRHAGGAIVPLTNRRYVRPFANAVASEMGGGRTISAPITINLQGTSVTADDVAEAVASSLNRISLMGA